MSGKYIVVFKGSATADQIKEFEKGVSDNGGSVSKSFDSPIMKGFSAAIPDSYLQTLQSLQGDVIDYIEPDGVVTTQ